MTRNPLKQIEWTKKISGVAAAPSSEGLWSTGPEKSSRREPTDIEPS
jgi:hypothetical protein